MERSDCIVTLELQYFNFTVSDVCIARAVTFRGQILMDHIGLVCIVLCTEQ